jgi:hypothetical protein
VRAALPEQVPLPRLPNGRHRRRLPGRRDPRCPAGVAQPLPLTKGLGPQNCSVRWRHGVVSLARSSTTHSASGLRIADRGLSWLAGLWTRSPLLEP